MKAGTDLGAIFEYKTGRELLVRLPQGVDLVQSVAELCRSKGIEVGAFTAIGALKRARLGYYDQKHLKYHEIDIESPHEMASCVGNVSLSEGKPFVHVHVVLADEKGSTRGGHLLEGTVFAAEVHLRALEGVKLDRKHDEATGLWLWKME